MTKKDRDLFRPTTGAWASHEMDKWTSLNIPEGSGDFCLLIKPNDYALVVEMAAEPSDS